MRMLTILLFAGLFCASCNLINHESIEGNGKITSRQRNVGSFNSVEASGTFQVHLQQSSSPSVKIETDENLMDYIETSIDNGTLVIEPKEGVNLDPSKEITVYVAAPEYKSLEVSGASNLISDGQLTGNDMELHASGASEVKLDVKLSKLRAELSGASTLQLRGSSSTVSTEASGASKVLCMDLATDETTLDLSGASNAEVNAAKQLNIDASGASDVKYRGNANINQKSSGASSVQKVS